MNATENETGNAALSANLQNYASLFGRLLLAAIFIWSGLGKLLHFSGTLAYMESYGVPMKEVLGAAAVVIELGGGLLLAIGWKTRWAAAAVFLFMIPITLIFHNPGESQTQLIHFMKNLSIMGGLLMLLASGPGHLSVDKG